MDLRQNRESFMKEEFNVQPTKIQSKDIIKDNHDDVDDKVNKLRKYKETEDKIKKEVNIS